jgi:hypothetical protein
MMRGKDSPCRDHTWSIRRRGYRTKLHPESHTLIAHACVAHQVGKRLCILRPNVPPVHYHHAESTKYFLCHSHIRPDPITPLRFTFLSSPDHHHHQHLLLLLTTSALTRVGVGIGIAVTGALSALRKVVRTPVASLSRVNQQRSLANLNEKERRTGKLT